MKWQVVREHPGGYRLEWDHWLTTHQCQNKLRTVNDQLGF